MTTNGCQAPECERQLTPSNRGRRPRYCSPACRQRAYRQRPAKATPADVASAITETQQAAQALNASEPETVRQLERKTRRLRRLTVHTSHTST